MRRRKEEVVPYGAAQDSLHVHDLSKLKVEGSYSGEDAMIWSDCDASDDNDFSLRR